MAKVSASHQAVIDCYQHESREKLAYHHILTAITCGDGRWGNIQRVGSVYDCGDSWVWQIAFTPRMRDAVIMETFKSHTEQEETVRCYFLADLANTYRDRSFESTDVLAKMQSLYWHAVEMERNEQSKDVAA